MARLVRPLLYLGAMIVAFSVLASLFPDKFGRHFMEDHTFELFTAVAFLAAFVVVAVHALKRKRVTRLGYLAGAAALLAFLDEMSFGERQFDLEAPQVQGEKVDALHDFLLILWNGLAAGEPIAFAAALAGVALVAIAATLVWRWGLLREDPDWPLFLVACLCVAGGLSIDVLLEQADLPRLERTYLEEHLELSAGILTLLFAWRSVRRSAAGSDSKEAI